MNITKEYIKRLVNENFDLAVEIRRFFHKNPELSFEEFKTHDFICSKLSEWGIQYKPNVAKTGVVAKIIGNSKSDKVIALRADIDALPINEDSGVDFSSTNNGVMHACGHDLHAASLLVVSKILNDTKEKWGGTILLIFQPGEELLPGGAKLMIDEGVFDEVKPNLIIGQHVLPEMETGKVGFCSGKYMASCDEIYLTINGKGGHGAMPHKITDTVLAASQIIVSLQQIVSRKADVRIPTVLSFGKFIANGATNVIPNKVEIEGTFRTVDEQWREEAHFLIKKIASGVAESMDANCDVNIKKGYPSLYNNPEQTLKCQQLAKDFLGESQVETMDIRMTAEDFSYFSQKYPSVFYRFGVGGKSVLPNNSLHSPSFVADEEALKTAVSVMTWIALSHV